MSNITESYLRVQYELRPAKQVERRMIVDSLQLLSVAGFEIRDYQYTGMGSIYFVDFILFHKLLGIHRMVSVEYAKQITKRTRFNKPFDCVDVKIEPIGDVIPTLSKDLKHLVWLDYDSVLCRTHLGDISLAAAYLRPGSILLVTVDVEPPGGNNDGPKQWREYYLEEAGDYLDASRPVKEFARSRLAALNIEIIERALKAGLVGRTDVAFIPIFNFLYADGHQMLTLGGMIGTDVERRKLRGSELEDVSYFRGDLKAKPYQIRIPRITRKERLFLDGAMPCGSKWKPKDFELSSEDILAYREVYRFLPAYAELLL
jgi:hypothetical protein